MKYVLYLKSSGEIIGSGTGSSIDDIQMLEDSIQGVVIVSAFPDPSQKCVVDSDIVDITSDLSLAQDIRNKELQQALLRSQRNSKLAETDWTQLADVSVTDKELWDNYRQALRDLPQTYANIISLDEVTWPEPPQ